VVADLEKTVQDFLDRQVAKYKQPCFDSSLFISKLNNEICRGIKRAVIFDWLWDKARNGDFTVFISAVTLAEVYKQKTRNGKPPNKLPASQNDEFLELIEEEFVEVIEVNRVSGLLANQLCRNYDIFPNDGMQLACAVSAKCDVFIAWDRPLIGKKHDEIRIEEPCIYAPNMFDRQLQIATPDEIKEYEERQAKANKNANKSVRTKLRGSGGGFIKDTARTKGKSGQAKPEIPNQKANGGTPKIKRSET